MELDQKRRLYDQTLVSTQQPRADVTASSESVAVAILMYGETYHVKVVA
jgi:hypothetical protein